MVPPSRALGTGQQNSAALELRERGADRDGVPQFLDRRLFVQLIALEASADPGPTAIAHQIRAALEGCGLEAVLYEDFHNPLGIAVVAFSEDPNQLALSLRATLGDPRIATGVRVRPEYSLLGRTYATGFEKDLASWLLDRPRRTLLDEQNQWAIWYPLRRKGQFERLEPREKGAIMQEHAAIGRMYGELDLAHDIRLACYGLDIHDNDFVLGLLGRELHPLSHVVQAMRKTTQTAEYVERMGPFFVGHALCWVNGQRL